jgi:hypothetical protein
LKQVNLPVDYGVSKLKIRLYDGSVSKDILISEGEVDMAKVMKEGEQDGEIWSTLAKRWYN